MNVVDKDTFFQLTEKFQEIPLTQSEGWYAMNSCYHPEKIIFMVNDGENPRIGCFGHVKKMGFIKMLLIEGERYVDSDAMKTATIRSFYSGILALGYDMVEVCSDAPYNFEYETAMRQVGFLRPVGQFSLPSTKIIDLIQPIKYNQNWKRYLKKSSEYNLTFEAIDQITVKDAEDFISINRSMTERKDLSFHYDAEQIYALCTSKDFQLFFVSFESKRIATTIIFKSKKMAKSLFAASSKEALKTLASYFMYEQMFNYLSNQGIQNFDMGKLLPSTDNVNNVFLFKNGVKGTHIQLNGEWSWYKKSIYRSSMYFVKKYLMKKREM